jgi:hypothetical protein
VSSRRPLPVLAAALAALLLGGCGSGGPTNRQQIAEIVRHEGVRPASLCDHLAASLLAHLGGRSGCLRQAAQSAPDPTTRATSISVHGHTATAVVRDRAGTQTIRLVKQRGEWKVSGVG